MSKSIRCWMMCLMLAQRSWLKSMPVAIMWVARVAHLEYCTLFSYPWQSTVLPLNRAALSICCACAAQEGPISFPPVMRWREDPAEIPCSECSCRLSLPRPFSAGYSTSAHLEPVVFVFPGSVEILLLWLFHFEQAPSFLYIHPTLSKKKVRWWGLHFRN